MNITRPANDTLCVGLSGDWRIGQPIPSFIELKARNIHAKDARFKFGNMTIKLEDGDFSIKKFEATYNKPKFQATFTPTMVHRPGSPPNFSFKTSTWAAFSRKPG